MARVEKSIEVNVPVSTAYNQWTQFEEFPRFMEGVKEVRQIDDARLHWRAEVGGKEKEWDVEITEQVPDQVIAWRSTDGTENAGTVRFQPTQEGGTQIILVMEYDPEGFMENVGDIVGVTSRRIEGDLERFREFIESRGAETGEWRGEVHQGQPTTTSNETGRGTSSKGQMQAEQQGSRQQGGGSSVRSSGGSAQAGSTKGATMPQTSRSGSTVERTGGRTQSGLPSFGGWEDPFVTVRRMADEMERMFEGFMGGSGRLFGSGRQQGVMTRTWVPPVEISQQGDRLMIFADLPGIRKEDLQVEIQDGVLTIEGERREESEQEEGTGYRRTERRYGHFYRSIQLPEDVDPNDAQASIHDGVLEINIPAPRRQQGRRLEIQESQQQSSGGR